MKHMLRLLAIILLALTYVGDISARSVREIIMEDVSRSGGNICVYPTDLIRKRAEAPKGYEAFYISHYGRHGSRNDLDGGESWKRLSRRFHQLDSMHVLTEYGLQAKREVDSIHSLQIGRFELLTDVGAEQHRGIARRMYASFPEVFSRDGEVHAIASSSRRCVASMKAFTSALKDCDPLLKVTTDSGKAVQGICRPGGSKNPLFPKSDYEAFKKYNSDHNGERYLIYKRWMKKDSAPAERMVENCSASLKAVGTSRSHFSYDVTRALVYGQNMGIDENDLIRKICTEDEIYRFYLRRHYDLLSRYFLVLSPEQARYVYAMKTLADDIVSRADEVIDGRRTVAADLRFGHDTFVLGLLSALSLNEVTPRFESVEELGERIPGYGMIPMAANLQFVFYRKGRNVIVRILLNENDVTLPIKSFKGPFYRWADVRKYLDSRFEKIREMAGGRVG